MKSNYLRALRAGFTLAELMVVIGILALLLAIALPALSVARGSARALQCSTTVRSLAQQSFLYANENDGFVPRDYTTWVASSRASWMTLLGEVGGEELERPLSYQIEWEHAAESDLFRCPEHALAGEAPGCFLVNAFKFETEPRWSPDGPTRLSRVVGPSQTVWYCEAREKFGLDLPWRSPLSNAVWWLEYRDVFAPSHVQKMSSRLERERHKGRSNYAFFDGSVRALNPADLTLSMFDDGTTQRFSDDVFSGN